MKKNTVKNKTLDNSVPIQPDPDSFWSVPKAKKCYIKNQNIDPLKEKYIRLAVFVPFAKPSYYDLGEIASEVLLKWLKDQHKIYAIKNAK